MNALDINLMPWHVRQQQRWARRRHWLYWGMVCALWGVAVGQLARMAWQQYGAVQRLEAAAAQLQAQADMLRASAARWSDVQARWQTLKARQQRLDQHDALITMLEAVHSPHTAVTALEGTAEGGRAALQSDRQEALQALLPSLSAAGASFEPPQCAERSEETPTCTLTLFWPWSRGTSTEAAVHRK